MMRPCHSILFLAGLLTAFLLRGAESTPVEQGSGLCRFILHGYTLPPQMETVINQEVSKSMKQHQELFGFRVAPDFTIRMRIFGNYEDYEAHTLKLREETGTFLKSRDIQELNGFYYHPIREIVTWRQKQPDYLANNILHEASHAIMMSHFRRMPVWLSEGCAVFFAFPRHIQDANDIGSLKYQWAKLNLWYREKSLPALAQFVNIRGSEWEQQDLRQAYAVSWSLFQYLMSTPHNRKVLRDFMNQMQERQGRRTSPESLLDKLYPGGVAALEKDWHRWIHTGGKRVLGEEMEEIIKRVQ